jgi:hypothetical protein
VLLTFNFFASCFQHCTSPYLTATAQINFPYSASVGTGCNSCNFPQPVTSPRRMQSEPTERHYIREVSYRDLQITWKNGARGGASIDLGSTSSLCGSTSCIFPGRSRNLCYKPQCCTRCTRSLGFGKSGWNWMPSMRNKPWPSTSWNPTAVDRDGALSDKLKLRRLQY